MRRPIARRLVGSTGLALVPAAIVGALVTSVADIVARQAVESVELPAVSGDHVR